MAFLTPSQVTTALAKNAVDTTATALSPLLRDVFGAPAGVGYTPTLLQLIGEFQWSVNLKVDGIVGRKTRAGLDKFGYVDGSPCAKLWPDTIEVDGQREHYSALCARFEPALPAGRPVLVGFRGVYPFARRTHRMIHAARYDDTFVLLREGGAPEVFRGATHAYQLASKASPDVSGDGRGDVGSIRPGTYLLSLRPTDPPMFHLTTPDGHDRIPAYRDTDHNGVISPEEAERSVDATTGQQVEAGIGMFATEILFHPGYDATDPHSKKPFASIGCQTAPLSVLQRLKQVGSNIDYVLATPSHATGSA